MMNWWQWLLIAAGVTVAIYVVFIVLLLLAGRRADARALAGFIPDCVVLFRRLLADGATTTSHEAPARRPHRLSRHAA